MARSLQDRYLDLQYVCDDLAKEIEELKAEKERLNKLVERMRRKAK